MNKIALITDSISDISKKFVDKYNIKVLPLKIIYKGKEYLDRINITPQQVYDKMPQEVPTTSLPSMDEINNLFITLQDEGYTHAIVIPVSSNLSGTFNAVKLISDEHPNIKTHVFDSKSISLGEGFVVQKCAELIHAGEDFDSIVEQLPNIRNRSHVFYVVDTLEYLKKGGRIGKVSGTIGQLLNIKPIISVNEDGIYYTVSKARGKKQAINNLLSIVKETLDKTKCRVCVLHGGAEEECKKLLETVSSLPNITSLEMEQISPTAGVHTGPGLLAIAFFEE